MPSLDAFTTKLYDKAQLAIAQQRIDCADDSTTPHVSIATCRAAGDANVDERVTSALQASRG
jgi:hypothetical protein